jgi:chemotaxis protein MotA
MFINGHALILVLGGTLAVTLMAFPLHSLADIAQFLLFGFFLRKKFILQTTVRDFIEAIFDYAYNPAGMVNRSLQLHPFIHDAIGMLNNPDITEDQLEELLHSKAKSFIRKYQDEAKMLVAISKFPPALGLLGASTGMIEMMQGVDGGGTKGIGAAMAVALVATFWGIALSNILILPLSDFAFHQAEQEKYLRETIIEAIMMLKRDFPPRVIILHLFNKLTPAEKMGISDNVKETIRRIDDLQKQKNYMSGTR